MIALKELIIYFCDNTLYIVHNMKIIEKKMDSIYQGLVVDRTKFIESFMQILKKRWMVEVDIGIMGFVVPLFS